MATEGAGFGALLARVRQQRGFPTAYAFYHGRDGRRTLGLTFRNYVNIEQGKNLPKPERLEAILLALGLADHRAEAAELVKAYYQALGLDALGKFLDGAAAGGALGVHAAAARSAVQKSTVQLTLEQWQLLAQDFEAHTIETLLANTRGGLETAEIATVTGLKPATVKRALAALSKAGLVKMAGARARCILEDKSGEIPPKSPAMLAAKAAMARQFERWAEEGKPDGNYLINVRLTKAHLAQFKQQIDYMLDVAELLSNQEPTADSRVYMVQTRVVDMFPPD